MNAVAVGFDFDHTLGLDHMLERSAFVELMRRTAAQRGAAFDVARSDRIADECIARYRLGLCSLADAFAAASEELEGRKATAHAFEQFKELTVAMAPQHVTPISGAQELLQQLDRAAIPYAILTNGWNPLQQRKAELIGFAKPVFVSDDIGARKPNVRAFEVLRDCFGLAPGQIWYVGDDANNDVLGALGAGMRAIWFDGEGKRFPTNVPAPTAIVTHLLDIVQIVM